VRGWTTDESVALYKCLAVGAEAPIALSGQPVATMAQGTRSLFPPVFQFLAKRNNVEPFQVDRARPINQLRPDTSRCLPRHTRPSARLTQTQRIVPHGATSHYLIPHARRPRTAEPQRIESLLAVGSSASPRVPGPDDRRRNFIIIIIINLLVSLKICCNFVG
jgi:hypothetical protein